MEQRLSKPGRIREASSDTTNPVGRLFTALSGGSIGRVALNPKVYVLCSVRFTATIFVKFRNKYTLSATILDNDATANTKSAINLRRHYPCSWVRTRRIESSAAVVRVANLPGFKPEMSLHRQSKKR